MRSSLGKSPGSNFLGARDLRTTEARGWKDKASAVSPPASCYCWGRSLPFGTTHLISGRGNEIVTPTSLHGTQRTMSFSPMLQERKPRLKDIKWTSSQSCNN